MQQDAADTVNEGARPEDCYILFSSHTDGWRLYESARDAGCMVRISPTPRRASCGVSLLASCDDVELLERLARGGADRGIARLPRQERAEGHVLLSGRSHPGGTPQAQSKDPVRRQQGAPRLSPHVIQRTRSARSG